MRNFPTFCSFIVEGDLNDQLLLARLFELVHFTHVLHLAAQVSSRFIIYMAFFHTCVDYIIETHI